MGFRFRKSFKAGPVRVNLSKSGVGYSVGGKGYRYTKKAGGGTRTTASIPGTGISYVKETGNGKTSKGKYARTQNHSGNEGKQMNKPKNPNTELILCLLLGWAGGHKFYQKKIGMGILYLLTGGLFFIGWWGDAIVLCIQRFGKKDGTKLTGFPKIASYIIAFLCVFMLGSCGGNTETDPAVIPTEAPTPTSVVAETKVTEAPTTEAPETEAPTETPTDPPETEAPTEAPTDPPETKAPTEAPTDPPETKAPTEPPKTEPQGTTYVLNTSTKKFHYPSCSSVDNMKESNKKLYTGTRDEVIAKGYDPCGRCHP